MAANPAVRAIPRPAASSPSQVLISPADSRPTGRPTASAVRNAMPASTSYAPAEHDDDPVSGGGRATARATRTWAPLLTWGGTGRARCESGASHPVGIHSGAHHGRASSTGSTDPASVADRTLAGQATPTASPAHTTSCSQSSVRGPAADAVIRGGASTRRPRRRLQGRRPRQPTAIRARHRRCRCYRQRRSRTAVPHVDPAEIHAALRERLPAYMVPAYLDTSTPYP